MNRHSLTFHLVVAGLALAFAACGSQPSSSAPQSQSPGSAAGGGLGASTSPVLITEWQETHFDMFLEQNRYGDPQAPLLKRNTGGHVVFVPLTVRDHVATRFVPVTGASGTVDLVLRTDAPGEDPCVARLQDQMYRLLATLPCGGSGERKTTADVAADVTQVRVLFQAEENLASQQLPTTIQLINPKG